MKLNKDKAARILQEKIADPLGLTIEEAATGIKKVVDTIMMRIECVGELLRNPPKLGSLESRRVAWQQQPTPSGVTDEAGKEAIEEQNVGRVGMSRIKRKTLPKVCHTEEGSLLAA